MEHKQIVVGDYVFTPCQNAFNSKISYWISKRDSMVSFYAFTPMNSSDLKAMTKDDALNSFISLYESMMKKIQNNKQEKTKQ